MLSDVILSVALTILAFHIVISSDVYAECCYAVCCYVECCCVECLGTNIHPVLKTACYAEANHYLHLLVGYGRLHY